MRQKNRSILFVFIFIWGMAASAQHPPRIKENFDFDWKFSLHDDKGAALASFNDEQWENVQVPHDWSIALPFDSTNWRAGSMAYLPGGIGWYRKTFQAPASYKGKRTTILFDGVYHRCDVYINGKHLGFHPYGYIGFEYDLSPYLRYDADNVIAVRVDHSDAPSSRWYSGSGIYRHVWLTVTDPIRVATWGTYITTPEISEAAATVKIVTTVENNSSAAKNVTVEHTILDAEGNTLAVTSSDVRLPRKKATDLTQQLALEHPKLWSPSSPTLYRILTVLKNGTEIDRYETSFGVRQIHFDADKGFFLNGKHLKLQGMNIHQDAGGLGTAIPDKSNERKLRILKEYGCNAIRCSHNPPSPEFLDLCDRLGFIVIDEAFDKWKSGYYADYFDEWWKSDLSGMLRRDRNHPSIVLWSVGNEVSEQNDTTQVGVERARMLQDYVHATEPTRPVTVVIAPADVSKRPYNKTGFNDVLDVVGYNYQEPWYEEDKRNYPARIMFGGEVFPFYRGRYGSVRDYAPTNPWYDGEKNDFIFGQFIWAGVDYLGESSGWPSIGWPTGLFDVCMFEKPRAAFHRSLWNKQPMVRIAVADQSLNIDPGKDHWSWPHLAAHWTFPQYRGHIIQVQTTSNCEAVELWVNNQSMGRRLTAAYSNNTIVWYVPYRAGKIRATGYNEGKEAATFELNTAGKPAGIRLTADYTNLQADGQDLSHIEIAIVDEKGTIVPTNDLPITIEISGQGQLISLDNGDLRNHEPSKGKTRTTYWGRALAVVQSSRTEGNIQVKAKAPGLAETTITLKSK
jgi:beta-galactosidase